MSEREEQDHQQSSDFPTAGYEAAEEERQSLKDDKDRNASVAGQEEEEEQQSPEPAIKQKRGERRGGKRPRTSTAISAAASAWQITLIDLDKQLNKQSRIMERMSDDIKHLRKQFNQVQRDLAKFEKHMRKMKTTTTPSSSAKRGKRRY